MSAVVEAARAVDFTRKPTSDGRHVVVSSAMGYLAGAIAALDAFAKDALRDAVVSRGDALTGGAVSRSLLAEQMKRADMKLDEAVVLVPTDEVKP